MLRLIAAALALACAACDERLAAPSANLAFVGANAWKLQSLERLGPGMTTAPNPERFTLQLIDEGRVVVVADCNRCSGAYSATAHQVTVSALACTRAFCQSAPFDTDFVTLLTGVSAVRISPGTLRLSSGRGTLRFVR